MKKVLLLASVAVLALSSCRKSERTCTCTKDGKETVTVYKKYTKKEAKSACITDEKTTKSAGTDITGDAAEFSNGDCKLK